eukprot:170496_1
MSYKKKSSKFNGRQSNEVLKYCPNYKKYDKRARNGSKTRINQHLSERRGGIINCVNQAIKEFKILDISIKKDAPQFIDDDKIIQNAAKQTTIQINKWDGVQISQCKKIMIDTFEKFAKKAKNHQDQTSWKISGDYFFAPYIQKARLFLIKYCKYMQDINSNIVIEIEYLLCLSFANALLYQEIKFHRTKPKPLMRHRTLVKSNGIHRELEALHKILTITKFISIAKEKRKKECGKSNIIAIDFFKLLKKFVNIQYLKQKKKVYKLLNKPDNIYFENNSDFDDIDNKNSDINDDDHSVENDDIDMRSNSPSVTPPSIGGHGTYVYDNGKKCRKGKQRINTFQCTNNNKKYNHEKQDKYIHKKKINRQNKINKKTNAARKYCDTLQIRDVNAINVLNSDFCSDCNNDNSTVSTITSSNVSNSMSPIRISNTIHNYNNNNNTYNNNYNNRNSNNNQYYTNTQPKQKQKQKQIYNRSKPGGDYRNSVHKSSSIYNTMHNTNSNGNH